MDASTLSFEFGILNTPNGNISFTHEEFFFYKSLFDIMDFDDDGRLSAKNAFILLRRSQLHMVRNTSNLLILLM
jgi:hypothetical protein